MKNNTFIFRANDSIVDKFNATLEAQNKLLEQMGVPRMTKTLFFEKLVEEEYLRYLNKQKDPETTDRINMIIDTRLEHAFRVRDKYIQEELFEARKTNAMLKLLLEKQNINIHNTEVLEQLENKSEVESIIEKTIAKEVFGEDTNKTNKYVEKVKADNTNFDDYDETQSQELTVEEIKMIVQNYVDEESEE